MSAVTELQSIDELNSLRLTWKQLWEQSPDASFFQSWDWLRGYWRAFGEGQKLRTLLVTQDARPIGIAPFVIRSVPTRSGAADILTWPTGVSGPAFAPIGPDPRTTLADAIKHVSRSREWHAIELSCRNDDRGQEPVRSAFESAGLTPGAEQITPSPSVELSTSWDCYMDERSMDCRTRYAHSEQHLSRFGAISFMRWRPGGIESGETARRWDLFSVFEQLTVDGDDLAQPGMAELSLVRELHPSAVDAASVDLCLLSIGGRTIACSYGYHRHGRIEVQYLASIGDSGEDALTVLIGHLLRDSFLRRDQQVVFHPEHAGPVCSWQNDSLKFVSMARYSRNSAARKLKRDRRRQSHP